MKASSSRSIPAVFLPKRPRHVQLAYDIYGSAFFNNRFHNRRAIKILADKIARPARSIARSCRTTADAKAAYRFLGNYKLSPNQKLKERVSREQLWGPIHRHSVEQSRDEEVVLVVQDPSCLMYPTLKKTRGLGTVSNEMESALWMQTAMGVRPDGSLIGPYACEIWARPVEELGKAANNKKRPFEEKESYLWKSIAESTIELFNEKGIQTRLVHVFDRGGDVHEVLEWLVSNGQSFIIRNAKDRSIDEEGGHIRAHLSARLVLETRAIEIPRTREHPKRTVTVEIRSTTVTISPRQKRNGREPFPLNLVWVHEPNPPDGVEPIDWVLYTTEPVETAEDCWKVVRWYKLRWRIEEYHRVLKTDCYAEDTQFKDAEGIVRLLAFLAVAAVRVLQLRDVARNHPDEPCTLVLEDNEWKILWTLIHEEPPPRGQAPPTIEAAVKMIGRLGGHLGRKGDGMPGAQSLSIGLKELETAVNICRLLGTEM